MNLSSGQLFDESLYRFDQPQPSWWEASAPPLTVPMKRLQGAETCDVVIIGGGYTGLSAALHLARDFAIDVRLLEAGHISWGASGRNGGFCTPGGTMIGLKRLISKVGEAEARRYFQCQMEAVELVRSLIKDEAIDADVQGDAELVVAESDRHFAELEKKSELECRVLGLDSRMISKDEFREGGYDAPHQHGALIQRPGFGLHPLRYARGLAAAAHSHGAHLHPHSEVIEWHKEDGRHRLVTRDGEITAKRVIVACNGFMPEKLRPEISGRAMPLQSQIIVTRPLSKAEVAAHNWQTENPAVNSRHVYFYYRLLPDRRFMIGGRADFTGTERGAEVTASRLHTAFGTLWPEWKDIEVEYTWRGFVCFTRRLSPAIGRLPDDHSVYFGFGYHGTGVNNATWTGKQLAHWLAGSNQSTSHVPAHLPVIMQGMPSRFPFAFLRPTYARAGVGVHRVMDWLEGIR